MVLDGSCDDMFSLFLMTKAVATKEKTPKNVCYITASELIGDAIVRIHERKPVSPLFAYNKKK